MKNKRANGFRTHPSLGRFFDNTFAKKGKHFIMVYISFKNNFIEIYINIDIP